MDNKIGKGLFWKLLERFGVQGSQFLLQLILARILDPEHYGVLSLMVIFTTLANVFIQTGFSTALVQNKDVTEEDADNAATAGDILYVRKNGEWIPLDSDNPILQQVTQQLIEGASKDYGSIDEIV